MISFLLTTWWIYLPIVAVLFVLTWKNKRKIKSLKETKHTLLVLEIPRANDNKELAAEQMFASLHGILRSRKERFKEGITQEHISFEIASIGNRIRFYVWLPQYLKNFVEGQIYAQYPTVQIHTDDEDYTKRHFDQSVVHTAELALTDNEVLPIKTFPSFEVDPLAAITATLSKLEGEGEEMWIQVIARPIGDSWHNKSARFSSRVRSGGGGGNGSTGWLGSMLGALWRPPEEAATKTEVSERDKSRITAVEEKSRKLGYQVKVRLVYLGSNKQTARLRMQAMVGTFKQFNSTNLNGFRIKNASFDPLKLAEYKARFFIDRGFIFNIEELASLYHLPHTTVETPNIVWANAKTAEPPANLPVTGGKFIDGISPFGVTNFRGDNMQFGIKRGDRGRHMYIIGQTGTGKSYLMTLLTLSDIFHNQGFAVVDPHGDYAMDVMKYIPADRVADVVYFNPADSEFPIGFNPMEVSDQNMKGHTSSELVGVLKRMFDSWGPRLEYILRYTILALLDTPETTMLDITRMLTDVKFRNGIIDNIQDIVVKQFWTIEFASWNDKFAAEAVAPVLNKVGAFVANPMIRNIIGQPKSSFDVRKIMDEGKILVVNLSRGLMGEDNAAIMGALIVTKIQLAAMSRANVSLDKRRPFYLYVDEFQNFATDSFAVILSEARKYGLNLTVANQYISQMPPEVKDAVFGNVGSMVVFRVGAEDGSSLVKYFEPQFESGDILQQNNYHFLATMAIDGEKTQAFSGKTLAIPPSTTDHMDEIIAYSRKAYSRARTEVENVIIAGSLKHEQKAQSTASSHSTRINTSLSQQASAPATKKKTRRGSRGGKSKTSETTTKPVPPSKESETTIPLR